MKEGVIFDTEAPSVGVRRLLLKSDSQELKLKFHFY